MRRQKERCPSDQNFSLEMLPLIGIPPEIPCVLRGLTVEDLEPGNTEEDRE
jgi:hypothetical protein